MFCVSFFSPPFFPFVSRHATPVLPPHFSCHAMPRDLSSPIFSCHDMPRHFCNFLFLGGSFREVFSLFFGKCSVNLSDGCPVKNSLKHFFVKQGRTLLFTPLKGKRNWANVLVENLRGPFIERRRRSRCTVPLYQANPRQS